MTNELKKEHAALVSVLNKVRSLGVSQKEGQHLLFSSKTALLDHLKKEDEQLYPVLNKVAESDADLKLTLDLFADEMDKISKEAIKFFDKYSEGDSGFDFSKDFGGLLAVLSQRIRKEENVLYQKYDQIVQ